jgi:hypothetical protein
MNYLKPETVASLKLMFREIWIQLGKPPQSDMPKIQGIGKEHYYTYLITYLSNFNRFYYNEDKKGRKFKDVAQEYVKNPVMTIPYTETPEYKR